MKFFAGLLTILAASSAYSYSLRLEIPSRNYSGIFKRGALNVSPECQKEIDNSEEYLCLGTDDKLNIETYKTLCPTINTDKCKKVIKNPIAFFPKCKNEKDFQVFNSPEALNIYKSLVELKCSTDGKGKLCPAAEVQLKGQSFNDATVQNSCKSKKCYDAFDKALRSLAKNLDKAVEQDVATKIGDTNIFAVFRNMLHDSTCTSKTIDDTKDTKDTKDTSNNNNISNTGNGNSEASSNNTNANSEASSNNTNVNSEVFSNNTIANSEVFFKQYQG